MTDREQWIDKFRSVVLHTDVEYMKDALDKVGGMPPYIELAEVTRIWNAALNELPPVIEEPAPVKKTTPRDATDFRPDFTGAVYHHCKAPFQRYVISDQRAVYYLTGDKAGKPVIPRDRTFWTKNPKTDQWVKHRASFVQLYDDKGTRRERNVAFLYENASGGRKVEKSKAAPKVKGKRGRPGKVDAAQVQQLRAKGRTVREIAGILGVGKSTVARLVPKCPEIKAGYITLNNSNFGTDSSAHRHEN